MDEKGRLAREQASRRLMEEEAQNHLRYLGALRRARERRWTYPGKSRVEHPKYGSVIVPHGSSFAAMLNAAEYWGADVREILGAARVWECDQSLPVVRPKEFCGACKPWLADKARGDKKA